MDANGGILLQVTADIRSARESGENFMEKNRC